MKLLKPILIAAVILALVGTIVIYFLPNQYVVTNSVEINRPANAVYAQLYDFNKWGAWDPWLEKDPSAQRTFEGTAGTPGHKMTWDGKKIGTGSFTIISSGTNQFVYSQFEITRPYAISAKDMIRLDANGDKTRVTWTSTGGLSFPGGRLFGLSADKVIGNDQKNGLDKLKKLVEAMPLVSAADSTATIQ